MIYITNGKDNIQLKTNELTKRDNNYVLFGNFDYWDIELDFICKKGVISHIEKCFVSSKQSGDTIKNIKIGLNKKIK